MTDRIASLSTMWGIGRFDQAADFVSAAKSVGFEKIELNPQVKPPWLQEILALSDAGLVGISSVHAPCPTWPGPGRVPELSALDEGERKAAVDIIERAVDLALRTGADRVVIHAGRVDIDSEKERALRKLFENGDKGTEEYRAVTRDLIQERADKKYAHLGATTRSLEQIQEYARDSGAKLGLENRYHYYEIPLLDEMQALLNSLDPAVFGYWHDVGHAHNLDVLGFQSHEEWLTHLGDRILGMHIHDAVGMSDHRPVGTGDVDFQMLRRHLRAGIACVCEFNSSWPPEEAVAGYKHLRKMGFF